MRAKKQPPLDRTELDVVTAAAIIVVSQRHAIEIEVQVEPSAPLRSGGHFRQQFVQMVQEAVHDFGVLHGHADVDRGVERSHQKTDVKDLVADREAPPVEPPDSIPQEARQVEVEHRLGIVNVHPNLVAHAFGKKLVKLTLVQFVADKLAEPERAAPSQTIDPHQTGSVEGLLPAACEECFHRGVRQIVRDSHRGTIAKTGQTRLPKSTKHAPRVFGRIVCQIVGFRPDNGVFLGGIKDHHRVRGAVSNIGDLGLLPGPTEHRSRADRKHVRRLADSACLQPGRFEDFRHPPDELPVMRTVPRFVEVKLLV